MTAPHSHTSSESRAAISRIEHNASGPGEPSGKKAGAPSSDGHGSTGNKMGNTEHTGGAKKGDDWVGGSGGQG